MKKIILLGLLIILIGTNSFVFVAGGQESEDEVGTANTCTIDSDCEGYCETRKPLYGEDYECQVKSCTSGCVINEYDPSRKKCIAEFEYYTEDFNEEKIIETAEEFIVSKVGKSYFDKHFEFSNVTTNYNGAGVLFSYKGDIPGEENNPFYFPNNDISIVHCKGIDYTISFVSSIIEPLDIEISREEAIKIAGKKGFAGPFTITISSGAIKKVSDNPSTHLSRPIWVLDNGDEQIRIDMFEGNLYTDDLIVELTSSKRNDDSTKPNYLYYIIGAIIIIALIFMVILFLTKKKPTLISNP